MKRFLFSFTMVLLTLGGLQAKAFAPLHLFDSDANHQVKSTPISASFESPSLDLQTPKTVSIDARKTAHPLDDLDSSTAIYDASGRAPNLGNWSFSLAILQVSKKRKVYRNRREKRQARKLFQAPVPLVFYQ